jgi:RimJ/RimL family protein N-acetyltransferase/calcineurin-like phosphoesterase family protein
MRYRLILKEEQESIGTFEDTLDILNSLDPEGKKYAMPSGRRIDTPNFLFRYVIKDKGTPVAFIELYPYNMKSKTTAYIAYAVKPEYQHRGLSKKLLDKAVDWCRRNNYTRLMYRVDGTNIKSIGAATKYGFKLKKVRHDLVGVMNISKTSLQESGNRMMSTKRYAILNDMVDITNIVKANLNKVYLDTDLHLTESNIERYIKLQNKVVSNNDIFICLGDIIYDEDSEKLRDLWYNYIAQLNGKYKFLVLGNNDILSRSFYKVKCGFDSVSLSIKLGNIIFTHCPIKTGSSKLINIHGHVHKTLFNTLTNTYSSERRIWINPTGKKFMYPKPYTSTEYYKTEIITKPVNLVQVLSLVKEDNEVYK